MASFLLPGSIPTAQGLRVTVFPIRKLDIEQTPIKATYRSASLNSLVRFLVAGGHERFPCIAHHWYIFLHSQPFKCLLSLRTLATDRFATDTHRRYRLAERPYRVAGCHAQSVLVWTFARSPVRLVNACVALSRLASAELQASPFRAGSLTRIFQCWNSEFIRGYREFLLAVKQVK